MDLTAQEIQEKQFHDAWRGYRQEEVDDFLDQISEALDRALRENAALKERNHDLGQAVATARDTEEMLKKTLVSAQRAAEEAIASAQAKADVIVAEAEERAGRLGGEMEERKRISDAEIQSSMDAADKATEQKRRDLDGTIERLEAYEGELRLRLKTFLEQQLEALSVLAERKVLRGGAVQAPPQAVGRAGGGAQVAPYAGLSPTPGDEAATSEGAEAHPEEGHYRRTLRNLFGRDEGAAALRPMIGPEGSGADDEQTINLEAEDEGVRIVPRDAGATDAAPDAPREEDGPDQRL
ncbi:MAG: DivIVA domain-containing protein [Actinobacteria bacterium]|nr:DivIVA domain-containing protein [Actinomycetota bacterium]